LKITHILILLISVFSVAVQADEAHPSKQFETLLVSCLPGGKKEDNCLSDTLLQFVKNEGLRNKLPGAIDGLFNQIIGDRQVYAVHPVISKKLGDFLVEENILIESDTGGLSLLRVLFAKSLNEWQIRNVHISSKEDTMENALNIKM